jgi:hypothetical protein
MYTTYKWLTLIALLIGVLVGPADWALAQDGQPQARLSVLETDSSRFPQINLLVRLQDQAGVAPQNAAFSVSENYENLSVATQEDALNVVFVFDASVITTNEQSIIKSAMTYFADNVYRSGDQITFLIMHGEDYSSQPFTSQADMRSAINRLTFNSSVLSGGYRKTLSAAVDNLRPYIEASHNAQIVLFGAYVPNGELNNANLRGIPLHVVHINSGSRGGFAGSFRSLATGQFVTATGSDLSPLYPLWGALNQNRVLYRVSYDSRDGRSGQRQVTLSAEADGRAISGAFDYSVSLLPPAVEITSAPTSVLRTASLTDVPDPSGEPGYVFDVNAQTIRARVSFPDGIERALIGAALVVDGQEVFQTTPPAGGEFELAWDLTNYIKTKPVTLAVRVTDEFNLQGVAPEQGATVSVNIPQEVSTVIRDLCVVNGQRINSPECQLAKNSSLALTTMLALAAGVVALAGVSIWQRRVIINTGRRATEIMAKGANQMRKTAIKTAGLLRTMIEGGESTQVEGGSQVGERPRSSLYAQVRIERGPGEGQVIAITKPQWCFGRVSDLGCDYVIAHPPVSGQHCTIYYDREVEQFFIEDHGSSNGTFVNGDRLSPHQRHPLAGEAEIRLATKDPVVMSFVPLGAGATVSTNLPHRRKGGYTITEDPNATNLKDSVANRNGQPGDDQSAPSGAGGVFSHESAGRAPDDRPGDEDRASAAQSDNGHRRARGKRDTYHDLLIDRSTGIKADSTPPADGNGAHHRPAQDSDQAASDGEEDWMK